LIKAMNQKGNTLATFLGWVFLIIVILALVYFFVPGVRGPINEAIGKTGVVQKQEMEQFGDSIDDEKVDELKEEAADKVGEALKDAGEAIGEAAEDAGDAIAEKAEELTE